MPFLTSRPHITAFVAAAVLVGTGVVVASTANASTPSQTISVAPGQSVTTALAQAKAGDVVLLEAGTYPAITLMNRDFGGVTLRGAARNESVLQGIYLKNVQHLTVHNLPVRTPADTTTSAIRITDASAYLTFSYVTAEPHGSSAGAGFDIGAYTGEPTPSHDIVIANSLYEGMYSGGEGGRGLRIYAGDIPSAKWPYNITLKDSWLRRSSADLVQIGGGRNVTITGTYLGKPQENSGHDDGIQAYGSDNLVVSNNTFTAPGTYSSVDQAIILGQPYGGTTNLKVTNSLLEGNVVSHWRGQGILLAGTTNTIVRNNTVTQLDGSGSAFVLSPGTWNDTNVNVQAYNNIFDKFLLVNGGTPTVSDYNVIGKTAVSDIGAHSYRVDPTTVFSSMTTYDIKPDSVAVNGYPVAGTAKHIGAR